VVLRTIPFGYQVENGKTVVQKEESEIVKKVFSLYVEGETLKSIADYLTNKNVEYYQGKAQWNKNKINRIIENEKYIGTEIYPMIISETLFRQAKAVKKKKSCKQEKQTKEIELLRSLCICGECGNRYKRINTWGSREKWLCTNGCSCLTYVDDTYLESSLIKALNTAIAEPCHLDVIVSSRYKPANDTIREENELIRLMEQPKLDFKVVSKSILQGASVRFDCCDYDDGEISDLLKEELSEMSEINSLDYTLMKEYIKQVIIAPDGEIATVFINNAKITTNGGTENAS
jgi:hypothetical protein